MKTYKRLFAVLAVLCVLLVNCKKKEAAVPVDFLLTKTWKPAKTDKNFSTNPPNPPGYPFVTNLYDWYRDCKADDTYKFNADGTMTIDYGTQKCDDKEGKIEVGTFNRAAKEISIKGFKFTLAEVSETQIKYYTVIDPSLGYGYAIYVLEPI